MSEIENKVTGEPTSSGEYYIEELVGRRCRVSDYQDLIGQLNRILQEADGLTAEQLNRLLKDAESRGFKKGMLHAAELTKEAKPIPKGLSKDEWIAVELTHDAVVKAIYNGLSN